MKVKEESEKVGLKLNIQEKLRSWLPVPSVQFSSVAQSCPTLCDPMNCSRPGLPVHHQLPEFTQTHAHQVGDVIQPSHPLSSPSPPAPNPSQHQGLFQWVITSWQIHEEAMETATDFIFLGSQITAGHDCSHKLKDASSLEEKLWQTQTVY